MKPEELDHLGFQLSHDLKGSLRNISLTLDLVSKSVEKNDLSQAQSGINIAKSISKKLWKLIDGLAGIGVASRASADEHIDMTPIVNAVVNEVASSAKEKQILITTDRLGTVYCDSSMIEEVWRQLLSNAIQSPNVSQIHIGGSAENGKSIFFIEDNGSGVAEAKVSKLFSSMSKSEYGIENVGLGLLFCRRVIERLGGRIWYSRENEKTRFSFELNA